VEASSKRAHTKEHNRRLILEAARGVFGRQGYRTATVRDIIGATSLASGTFYNYFKSKEEVFAALRDELAEEIRPLLRVERERAKTAEEFIAGTFRAFLSHVAAHSSTLIAIKAHDDDISPARTAVMGNDDLRRDIEAAIARGLFAELDAELLAAAIIGVAFEVADVMRQRSPGDVHRATQFCADLVLRGVPAPPGAAR
jgi:AcrR family transcriptional regulator